MISPRNAPEIVLKTTRPPEIRWIGSADTVLTIENARQTEGIVIVAEPVQLRDHIRKRGEETSEDKAVLARGTRLGPVLSRGAVDGLAILRRNQRKCQACKYGEYRSWRPMP